jgi:predicted regulator of Ras-like GTPase activity (Roadblock/LC7/MglB family)
VEPRAALVDLREISTEVEAAVILDADGTVLASTLADEERSREVARIARDLLETADGVRRRPDLAVAEVEVALRAGSVFFVRQGDRTIVASTGPEPATGLILYDLKSCLRSIDDVGPPAEEHEPAP